MCNTLETSRPYSLYMWVFCCFADDKSKADKSGKNRPAPAGGPGAGKDLMDTLCSWFKLNVAEAAL